MLASTTTGLTVDGKKGKDIRLYVTISALTNNISLSLADYILLLMMIVMVVVVVVVLLSFSLSFCT